MWFEWDERKRRENRRKHGLDFAECAQVFEGPYISDPDERFAYGEHWMRACGLLRDVVVYVAYTEIEEVIRVITMRRATIHEEKQYFENI